jgi:hypothetical protein
VIVLTYILKEGGNHGLQIKRRRLWDSKESHSEEGTGKEEEIALSRVLNIKGWTKCHPFIL